MNKPLIVLAGATGHLGKRIAQNLTGQKVKVRALIRPGSHLMKIENLKHMGAELQEVDFSSTDNLFKAVEGGSCVISAFSGLHPVIIDAQSKLLDATVAARVPRFCKKRWTTTQDVLSKHFSIR